MLDVLGQLVDKSLVVADRTPEGSFRYRMLETLGQYAQGRLAASAIAESIAHCHAEYYAELAERAEPELTGGGQRVWLERLERDHNNLRSALRWTLEAGNIELGMRLAGAVWRFWWVHGYLSEGQRWFDALLAAPGTTDSALAAVRAKAWLGAGYLAFEHGDYSRAAALAEQSLTLRRELGDKPGSAQSLVQLGLMARDQGDHRRAIRFFEQGLALSREARDKYLIAG